MLIVCPNCATSYTVGASALGLAGRNVRCVRCRTQWFAAPPQAAGPASTATFIDEIIAEADAKSAAATPAPKPVARAAPRPAKPNAMPPATTIPQVSEAHATGSDARRSDTRLPDATPIAPVESPDATQFGAAQFGAALEQVSAVAPMRTDDVSGDAPMIDAPTHDVEPHIGDAPPIVPPAEPPFGATDESDDVEHAAARRGRGAKKARQARQRGRRIGHLPVIITLLVVALGAILIWRNTLVKYVPQTASLFSAIGMPVNVRGLVFEGVTVSRDTNDGVAVLAVEGKIVSTSSTPVDVPRLRFAIRNATGNEIYTWTAQPPRSILGAGETMTFRSRLAAPPTDGTDVLVRFFNAHDLPGSK